MSSSRLNTWAREHRRAVLGLVALQLREHDGQWAESMLHLTARAFQLEPEHALSFLPLLGVEEPPGSRQLGAAFHEVLAEVDGAERARVLQDLLVLITTQLGYCARARSLLRRLAHDLGVPWAEIGAMESTLGAYLAHRLDVLTAETKDNRWRRYAQIGSAAVVGGVALGLTAGAAAPALGILAATFGAGGVTAALSASVLQTVFGVAGAGLAGYKMRRRTKGVQQFDFMLQPGGARHLSVTVCISGWLRDAADCKRPWGVVLEEGDVPLRERLQRFFHAQGCPLRARAVKRELCDFRRSFQHIAKPPRSSSFKQAGCSRFDTGGGGGGATLSEMVTGAMLSERSLTQEEEETFCWAIKQEFGVDSINIEPPADLVCPPVREDLQRAIRQVLGDDHQYLEAWQVGPAQSHASEPACYLQTQKSQLDQSTVASGTDCTPLPASTAAGVLAEADAPRSDEPGMGPGGVPAIAQAAEQASDCGGGDTDDGDVDDGGAVWWWRLEQPHCGDHYLLRWETDILVELANSVYNMVKGMGSKAMTQTVINSLGMSAMMLPMTVIGLAGMIDGTWTIATERADEAGALLAELLLRREHGARPVTLVGFSMGSRLIFSCLKELVRHHEEWQCKQAAIEGGALHPGRLLVRVKHGQHTMGRPVDAYVFLRLGAQILHKMTEAGPVHPDTEKHMKWEKDISFAISDPDKLVEDGAGSGKIPLQVELWAKKSFGFPDKLMGYATVNVEACMQNPNRCYVKQLTLRPPDDYSRAPSPGQVNIEVTFEPVAGNYDGAAGIIENVVLMGSPISSNNDAEWQAAKALVSGRLVNVYSKHDWVLGLIFRYKQLQLSVAGIEEVRCGVVENIDVGDIVRPGWDNKVCHALYISQLREIMRRVDLDSCMPVGCMGAATCSPVYELPIINNLDLTRHSYLSESKGA